MQTVAEELGVPLQQHTVERNGSARRDGKSFAAAAAATMAAAKLSNRKEPLASAAATGASAASAVRRAMPARMAMAALGSLMPAGRNSAGGGADAHDTSHSNSGAMTDRRPEPSVGGSSTAEGGAGASAAADHVVLEMTARPQQPQ